MGSSRILGAIVALCALGGVLGAQPKTPTDAQKLQAGELVKQAIAKSQAGDHQAAIELYMNAFELIPQPVLLSNIGTEYQQLKKRVEALKYFCKYLEKDPAGPNVGYATAQAKVIVIELYNAKDVDDASVCRPQKPVGDTAAGAGSAAGTGTGAGSGAPAGPTPIVEPQNAGVAPSGGHGLQYAGAGVAVAGAVAFGFGIYYGIHAKDVSDFITNYTRTNPGQMWPADINARERDGKSAQTNQIVLDIIGPVAIVAGGVMFVVGRPKKGRERVGITPIATPTLVGLSLSGGF
jgi:hypothetical protein